MPKRMTKDEQDNLEVKVKIAVLEIRLIELYAERDVLEGLRKMLVTFEGYESTRLAIVLNTLSRLNVYLHNLRNSNDPR